MYGYYYTPERFNMKCNICNGYMYPVVSYLCGTATLFYKCGICGHADGFYSTNPIIMDNKTYISDGNKIADNKTDIKQI